MSPNGHRRICYNGGMSANGRRRICGDGSMSPNGRWGTWFYRMMSFYVRWGTCGVMSTQICTDCHGLLISCSEYFKNIGFDRLEGLRSLRGS